ncbi:sigma-70 family RNA polymerase sigma factor [Streptomyces sp. CL7]|uniref:RNA polymerase sigma factor n=1 Tax=Streptomyces sp. CL7 TaxID=3096006 RepID=UPI002A74F5E0|nr:sigma-70 family RNA polymerase sigma factor [Streptomyces sp. CL7]WPP32275.1 sigma-70 family RNA polymerase sigma factor [Streptomyces sp. CL7]
MAQPGESMRPQDREFADFFERWEPQVNRYLIWLEGDPSLIDDATQETMISAHRYWRRLQSLENVRAWLFKIARQRLSEARRARIRHGLSTAPHELPEQRDDAHDALALRVDQLAILEAVRKLPPRQATAMALQLQYDCPLHEIADIMEITTGSVKTHLHHARANLETLLADVDGGAR